jgi:hypothetical protein
MNRNKSAKSREYQPQTVTTPAPLQPIVIPQVKPPTRQPKVPSGTTAKPVTPVFEIHGTNPIVIPPHSEAIVSSGPVSVEDKANLERMAREYDEAERHLAKDTDNIVLHDLFLTDFVSTDPNVINDPTSANRSGFTIRNDPPGSQTHIEYVVIRKLSTGSKLLLFYVLPTSETEHICILLVERYKIALGDFMEGRTDATQTPGDSEQVTSQELVFTNHIYIYHETYLSPEQVIAVRNAYKHQGLTVILRGTDYLDTQKLAAKVRLLERR